MKSMKQRKKNHRTLEIIKFNWHRLGKLQRLKIIMIVFLDLPTSKNIIFHLALTNLIFVFLISILPHHYMMIPTAIGASISIALIISTIRSYRKPQRANPPQNTY